MFVLAHFTKLLSSSFIGYCTKTLSQCRYCCPYILQFLFDKLKVPVKNSGREMFMLSKQSISCEFCNGFNRQRIMSDNSISSIFPALSDSVMACLSVQVSCCRCWEAKLWLISGKDDEFQFWEYFWSSLDPL